MNARNYRVKLNLSPLDFPPISGIGESSLSYRSEVPQIINNRVVLTITKMYVLHEMSNNKDHEILSAQSVYEIPAAEIKSREDAYEFYKDATQGLNEAFQYARTQLPTLPKILFPYPPIVNYQKEIDRIFHLLNSRN